MNWVFLAVNLQPVKPVNIAHHHPNIQTIALPGNQPTAIHGNQHTGGTQNITFGNILSVQQKPSSDNILVLNPTGVQIANNGVVATGSMATTTAFVQAPNASHSK